MITILSLDIQSGVYIVQNTMAGGGMVPGKKIKGGSGEQNEKGERKKGKGKRRKGKGGE